MATMPAITCYPMASLPLGYHGDTPAITVSPTSLRYVQTHFWHISHNTTTLYCSPIHHLDRETRLSARLRHLSQARQPPITHLRWLSTALAPSVHCTCPRGAHGVSSLLGEASGKRDKMRTPQTPTKPPIVMHCHGSPHKPLVSLVGTIGLAIPRCLSRQLCLAAATRTARMHISTPCRSSCGSSFSYCPTAATTRTELALLTHRSDYNTKHTIS
jgi:hypothetical protein